MQNLTLMHAHSGALLGWGGGPPGRTRLLPFAGVVSLVAALVIAAAARGALELSSWMAGSLAAAAQPLEPPPDVDLLALLVDRTTVRITVTTADWRKQRQTVTTDAILHDRALWRSMRFDDWDSVPPSLRRAALRNLLRAHAPALEGPVTWRAMTARDWDLVPQPVGAIATLRMVWYWAMHERVAAEFGLRRQLVTQTIAAIIMTESWFEHRAVNVNEWGNRDIGLAQCSDYCREEIALMADRGDIDFRPSEADYFNPFVAARIATVWFQRELRCAEGDIELATRAYHRGLDDALDARADRYLLTVRRLRARYIRTINAPPAWADLVALARLERP